MADHAPGNRLVAILWFVAAGLAFLAVGIGLAADRDPKWSVAAGGLFCLVMGIATWSRRGQAPPSAK